MNYRPLNDYRDEAFRISKEKGWKAPAPTVGEGLALIHSEVSEALEEYRNGYAPDQLYHKVASPNKPEGVPAELADVLIRVFDFCGQHGIDIAQAVHLKMNFNRTRPHRHGNKKL